MKISVVIPTLDEAPCIVGAVESAIAPGVEVVVVDGGSRDETARLARDAGARVLACERGRARQLRMGSEASTGDALLFLHADTRLERGWPDCVAGALSDPGCAGGAFRLRFVERGWRARAIEWGVAVRVALFGLPYGDQALFVRRSVLEQMGGLPIVAMMEDLDLVRAIKRAGRLRIVDGRATTSARRYVETGALRTVWRHQLALIGWWLGWDRERLAVRLGR